LGKRLYTTSSGSRQPWINPRKKKGGISPAFG
jgi:hypothetical protein